MLESEELRLAWLRIESQRDQLDAAFIDLRSMESAGTERGGTAMIRPRD